MRANKLTCVLIGAAALTAGFAGIASASTSTDTSSSGIVTVTHNDGGTQVGTGLPGQPLLSVSVDDRGICVGFSLEVPFCLPVSTG